MAQSELLAQRIMQEGVAPEEVVAERERILRERDLALETVFDTFSNESGKKDVVSAITAEGKRVILRLGERRPTWFFPEGFAGESIRIPRVIAHGGERIPFEIEEAIGGTMMDELDRDTEAIGKLGDTTLRNLAAAFWEFQTTAASLPLESLYSPAKAGQFLARLDIAIAPSIRAVAERHRDFFDDLYPSKWKFATDNLILDADGRVAFIDNAKLGKRYFGYDIGWVIWPSWLHMSATAYADVEGHLAYLDHVKHIFFSNIPDGTPHPIDLDRAFTLIVFERLVGSLFDVANNTKHLVSSGLDPAHTDRRKAHEQFLYKMLEKILDQLK